MFALYWLVWWIVVGAMLVVIGCAALTGIAGLIAAVVQFRNASRAGAARAWAWLLLTIPGAGLTGVAIAGLVAVWPTKGPFG